MESVPIQGIEGSFHHEVFARVFGEEDYEIIPCESFEALFAALVEDPKSKYAIVAIENSGAGVILDNVLLLQKFREKIKIVAEVVLPIRQALIAQTGIKLQDVSGVYSHPMALFQSSDFLSEYFSPESLHEYPDTALAIQDVSKDIFPKNSAVVGNGKYAESLGLSILEESIADDLQNRTRFLILEKKDFSDFPEGEDQIISFEESFGSLPEKTHEKVTLLIETADEKGALLREIQKFSDRNLSFTQIHSLTKIPNGSLNVLSIRIQDRPGILSEVLEICESNDLHLHGLFSKKTMLENQENQAVTFDILLESKDQALLFSVLRDHFDTIYLSVNSRAIKETEWKHFKSINNLEGKARFFVDLEVPENLSDKKALEEILEQNSYYVLGENYPSSLLQD